MNKYDHTSNVTLKLLLTIILSVILSEVFIMFFLSYFFTSFTWKLPFLDAVSLTLIIFPTIYFFVCRPLKLHIQNSRKTEKTLEHLIHQNELILEAASEGIFGLNSEGKIMFVNPAAARMLGYEAKELIGESSHAKVHHTKPDGTAYPVENCPIFAVYKDRAIHYCRDEYFWKKDGTSILIECSSSPIIEKGELKGAVVTFRDLTERKKELDDIEAKIAYLESLWTQQQKAAETLREIEANFRRLFNESRDAIYIISKDGKFLDFNQSMLDLFDYSKKEMFGLNLKDLYVSTNERNRFQQAIGKNGSVRNFEVKFCKKGRTEIDCLVTSSARKDDDGNVLGYHGIIHDITERKRLEHQLLQAQKMEAVGRLAGGIAHDFNNILTAIIGYANLLKLEMQKDDPLGNYATQIINSSERAANLTRALLTFSRKQVISPRPVNINEIIKGVERLLSRLIGEDVELSIRLTEKDLMVMADTTQIEQVLMNLTTNARDAMPDGGSLIITTELIRIDNEYIKAHGYGKSGDFALITVEDTGQGIDEKIKEWIFEPFFTTKEVGKGTGLGLAMAYGIIKQHEGYINVYSDIGKGTTFKIYLPLIASGIEDIEQSDLYSVKGGSETILIAEDDIQVRGLTRKILEKAGYSVIEAVDGSEGVRLFNENRNTIQLLILDVIMPKMNGKECYVEIRKTKPDIKTIFMSGYTADIIQKKGILTEQLDLILKPISPNELLRKVREVLDRSTVVNP